ncbi:4-phosphopantetheinyl transferase family protein [Flavobacterium piscinae]|uniref:4-phosphopantetheinyl transferase family protein n=1 Tax=Flavobacterium piscinae TaxID=2506424 RepID=A0A4Q1KRE6_9FLAO|nr:4'-phosphopantetheinyl transferase superfamily protein [Flavobacterium piscinae]MBC8882509.1 4-phosphopantetheinyl transferase family protein [Flavobacterium piscinae]RXR32607.1 4-phosphopantetheinyl transferase family protein [Flavobacterium piscinae]
MIGNDLVDLALAKAESNWRRKGFLDKVFTTKEKNLIYSAENPTLMVWVLWSRKEAVYKIIRQQNGLRGFYPLRIENSDYKSGIIVFEEQLFYTKTTIDENFIHSIALQNQAFNRVVELSNVTSLYKRNEIPYLIEENRIVNLSKSHHGRYEKVVRLI